MLKGARASGIEFHQMQNQCGLGCSVAQLFLMLFVWASSMLAISPKSIYFFRQRSLNNLVVSLGEKNDPEGTLEVRWMVIPSPCLGGRQKNATSSHKQQMEKLTIWTRTQTPPFWFEPFTSGPPGACMNMMCGNKKR